MKGMIDLFPSFRRHRPRWPLATLVTLTAIATTNVVAPATPAVADSSVLSCPGSQTLEWNPGLRWKPRLVAVEGTTTLRPCVDPTGPILTGSSAFDGNETYSCRTVVGQAPGTEEITWNTGETTTFSWTASEITNTSVGGAIVVTIITDIESGKFKDMQVTYAITSVAFNPLACFSAHGVTSASGPILLTIVP